MKLKQILETTLVSADLMHITIYNLLEIILIFVITWLVNWSFRKFFLRSDKTRLVDMRARYTIYAVLKYTLWVIAIALILQSIGIKITLLIAGSAALLVGVGLGLQQIFKDIISGFFLLFERTIRVGDVVETEGFIGKVQDIGIRTSSILTRDNIVMIIPNSRFIEGNVINWSTLDEQTRFHVEVGVAYGSDVRKVEALLISCATNHPDISKRKKPFVFFKNFSESSLDFALYFWTVKGFEVERIKSELRFSINETFRKNDISIPYPQYDIHIRHPLK
ncbi:MAG: mechanosensitive ion channel [Chlorobi bacterium]|nr:mechanosensitive ion channel [Chlorobiota bacterium]